MVIPYKNYNNLPDFIDYIDTFVGYLEKATSTDLGDFTDAGKIRNAGYNNYTIYWDWYKQIGYGSYQGQPYCANYVSAVLTSAFGLEKAKKLLYGNLFIFCPDGYNQFKAVKRIYSTPKVGDIIFFWSSSLNRWGHTGIVVGVDANGNGYTTNEANTTSGNDIVVRNGGATCIKHYTLNSRKVAFGRPDYEANGISLTKPNWTFQKTYSIGSGIKGLTCTADALNVRATPGASGKVLFKINKGNQVIPSKKIFINGDPWFYITYAGKSGWCSAKYFDGWVQEFDYDGKWWYLRTGYTYPTNSIEKIEGNDYFFDAGGWMFVGAITFTTNADGVLKYNE